MTILKDFGITSPRRFNKCKIQYSLLYQLKDRISLSTHKKISALIENCLGIVKGCRVFKNKLI